MGQLDYVADAMHEQDLEEYWPATLAISTFARLITMKARQGLLTDVEGFAQVAEHANSVRVSTQYGPRMTEAILSDLKQVIIGEGFTNASRNHGPFALPYNAFLDTGFKRQFRDGGNQVQHAMAGIWLGYYHALLKEYVYWQEDGIEDLALYDATFPIGSQLNGEAPITELPRLIRTLGPEH